MERLTLREAAERTSRSITTLRRYIRSGRLRATKENGRYGPEYFVSEADLADAGLDAQTETTDLVPETVSEELAVTLGQVVRGMVPLTIYQELRMKHEQLLVQYGMIRAAGLRTLELKSRLEAAGRELEDWRTRSTQREQQAQRERRRLGKRLREAELELEARRLENAALREKVRGLELLTRNAVTSESIDRQFDRVARQRRRVEQSSDATPVLPGRSRPLDH